jgi:5-formyltetrahydrofolate cyclo-ligase
MSFLSKGEARKWVKAKLAEFTQEIWLDKSLGVSRNIQRFLKENPEHYSSTGIIGGFAPLHDEVNWLLELDDLSKQFAFPGTDENGDMLFLHCRYDELIETREFGVVIKSPPESAQVVTPDLLLVPGLGFDKTGERLGRGKGFYDKYLENFNGLKIGICTSEQLLEGIPTEPHDIHMDGLITDSEIFMIRS